MATFQSYLRNELKVDFDKRYVGSSDDKGGAGLDRTKEGYVEIIEMATYQTFTSTSIAVTHVGGVPDCGAKFSFSDAQAATDASSASGGLFGGMTLINVGAGTDYTEDSVPERVTALITPPAERPNSAE